MYPPGRPRSRVRVLVKVLGWFDNFSARDGMYIIATPRKLIYEGVRELSERRYDFAKSEGRINSRAT